MTEEYKIELLNYVLGNYETTSSDSTEIFEEQEEILRDKWSPYLPSSWNNFRFEGMVAGNELTTNLSVLYGGYVDTKGVVHGIIVLVDENFMPVKTIYKRDAGNDLRYIQYMKQAEDGTFFYIDSNNFSYANAQKTASNTQETRFMMTNNFTIKNEVVNDYVVSYRKYYYFGSSYKNFYCKNMYKDANSSHYIFFGQGGLYNSSTGNWSYRTLRIIGLKVNVGSSNEWTSYVNENERLFGSAIATFEDDKVRFRCLVSSTLSNATTIDLIGKTYTGNPATSTVASFGYHPYVDDYDYKKQSVFLDYDNVYFVQNNQRWGSSTANDKYIGLYKYDVSTTSLTTIFSKSLGSYTYTNQEAIYIDRCNNDIYVQYNTNIDGANYTADYYFQRLDNDIWNPTLIKEEGNFRYDQRTIYVKSNFNLLQVYLYSANPRITTWFQYLIKEDYNSNNYNGIPYIDYNSLISKKGRIYSDNKLVFARNLYNKTQNNGTTVSTIQVPNNYLNNITLDLKTLLSETNLAINNDTNETSKNIYEMMFVNYINTINVIDEDTNIVYPNTATYINTNANTGTQANYNDTFIGKVRVNYTGSTDTQDIVWQKIDDTHYQTNFLVNTSNVIESIEFLSEDENTTYITKTLENLEENKTYVVNQKIRIE